MARARGHKPPRSVQERLKDYRLRGAAFFACLQALILSAVYGADSDAVATAHERIEETRRPFALVMSKGTVEPYGLDAVTRPVRVQGTERVLAEAAPDERLTRTQALTAVTGALAGDEAVIATTGKTGRELYELADRENQLYVVGGMGTASAIGFGIAHAAPRQRVVVLDGAAPPGVPSREGRPHRRREHDRERGGLGDVPRCAARFVRAHRSTQSGELSVLNRFSSCTVRP